MLLPFPSSIHLHSFLFFFCVIFLSFYSGNEEWYSKSSPSLHHAIGLSFLPSSICRPLCLSLSLWLFSYVLPHGCSLLLHLHTVNEEWYYKTSPSLLYCCSLPFFCPFAFLPLSSFQTGLVKNSLLSVTTHNLAITSSSSNWWKCVQTCQSVLLISLLPLVTAPFSSFCLSTFLCFFLPSLD